MTVAPRSISATTMKSKLPQDYTHTDDLAWQPFPEAFSEGGITWKLLNVSPEMGCWTAMFDCPTGSSFARHIHMGPGEYFLMSGVMEVQGGEHAGGITAVAPAYGYEPCNARHDRTYFVEGGQFYMTFLGPLQFIQEDGTPIAVISWEEAQGLWAAQNDQTVPS